MSKPYIRVAAGVILNQNQQVLLAQRPEGKPWSGWWEFPGGKIEEDESVEQALARELKEELGIEIAGAQKWVRFVYEYPKNIVELWFCKVTEWQGEPRGLENQAFAWTEPAKAHTLGEVLPASEDPLKWLQLPEVYALSQWHSPEQQEAYKARFEAALEQGVRLFQLREPNWPEGVGAKSLQAIFEYMLERCHAYGAQLIVNSVHPKAWAKKADGIQLRAQDAVQLDERPLPKDKLVGVSCHHLADILYAQQLEADFMVLGHVLETASHPDRPPIGWTQFSEFAQEAGRPVLAIGGQSMDSLKTAQAHGAHGVAILRAL